MQIQDCLTDAFSGIKIPEMIAVITGIASVWFAKKENILVYPVGIISVLLYVYICLDVKLYADAAINFYYFIVSLYGWYYWKYGGKYQRGVLNDGAQLDSNFDNRSVGVKLKKEAEISSNSFSINLLYLIAAFLIGAAIGYSLFTWTDSKVPYWDGITAAFFFIAMLLMAKKKIEHWVFWIIGDILCIPLFYSKGLCFSSLQYIIFTMLAVAGFIAWYRKLQNKNRQI